MKDIPRELQGEDVHFRFVSPLHEAIERKDASTFLESKELITAAIEMGEESAIANIDVGSQLRAALEGIGVDQKHLRTEDEVEAMIAQAQEMQEAQQAAEIAKTAGAGARDLAQAEATMH